MGFALMRLRSASSPSSARDSLVSNSPSSAYSSGDQSASSYQQPARLRGLLVYWLPGHHACFPVQQNPEY